MQTKTRAALLASGLLAALAGIPAQAANYTYYAYPLHTLGGTRTHASGIGKNCDVVGYSRIDGNQAEHAFRLGENCKDRIDLGTLGGSNSAAFDFAKGFITGRSEVAGDGASHAFIIDLNTGGAMVDLGTLGGQDSAGLAVTEIGRVAGWAHTATGQMHAFVTAAHGGAMQDLGTLPGGSQSAATDVNWKCLCAVGWSETKVPGVTHAFYTYNSFAKLKDIGNLGGGSSRAAAVNKDGVVVGASQTSKDSPFQAFITARRGHHMRAIQGLGYASEAMGMSVFGRTVGTFQSEPGADWHAFVTDQWGSSAVDLNAQLVKPLPDGVYLVKAHAIAGGSPNIVATGSDKRAYLLCTTEKCGQ